MTGRFWVKSYTPHPDTVQSRLGGDPVILHLARGLYFGIDALGTIIWERIRGGDTPLAICSHIRETFTNVSDQLELEVNGFLYQVLENELIEAK